MDEDRSPETFSDEQRAGLEARQADQDRTLEAMHRLEAALAEAAPGREAEWRQQVVETLVVLEKVTADEAENAVQADSLLSDLNRTQPRLRNRVRALRLQYQHLRDSIEALRHELELRPEGSVDFGDVRQRAGWVLTALRHQRARESDLIYEAYYEAFRSDMAAEAASG